MIVPLLFNVLGFVLGIKGAANSSFLAPVTRLPKEVDLISLVNCVNYSESSL